MEQHNTDIGHTHTSLYLIGSAILIRLYGWLGVRAFSAYGFVTDTKFVNLLTVIMLMIGGYKAVLEIISIRKRNKKAK